MSDKCQNGFEIAPFSDLDYDQMTVEIRFQGNPVAQLSKDKGLGNFEITIPSKFSPSDFNFNFPVDDFLDAVVSAKSLLTSLG